MTIDTPLFEKMFEAETNHHLVERDVPDPTSSLHAVETFVKFPYPVRFARFLEARRLFNKNCFRLGKNPMKEGSFEVKMLDIPVKDSGYMHEGTEGFKACSRSCYLS